jgi:hypothetical protein
MYGIIYAHLSLLLQLLKALPASGMEITVFNKRKVSGVAAVKLSNRLVRSLP